MGQNPEISIIIPVYDEAESLVGLYQGLTNVLDPLSYSFDIIFVDDGEPGRLRRDTGKAP
jgi:glycosyltransferase involved in cell wall biosynthesis